MSAPFKNTEILKVYSDLRRRSSMTNKLSATEVISFVVIYLLVCGFIIAFSPLVLGFAGHDITPVIDGAWRIENNQIPHKDFPSILGYGYLLQQYFFLKIFNYDFIAFTVSSISITTILFLIFLSFYSSKTFIKNTTLPIRCYLFLLIVALGLGQYNFGTTHTLVTYANLYNRYGFLCLLIVFIQLILLKDKKMIDAKVTVALIIAALLLNYLLFVKLTYFLIAVGLFTLFWSLSFISFKIYFRILLISLSICTLFVLITNTDFFSILRDYKTISSAHKAVFINKPFLKTKFLEAFTLLLLLSYLLLFIELFIRKVPFKYLLLIGFIGACSIFLHLTNWGQTDIVMFSFVPVVFILLPGQRKLLTFKIMLAVSCLFIFKNFRSIYYLSKVKQSPYTELKSKYLSHFYIAFSEIDCGEEYATRVMSGVDLININKKAGDKIFTFSFDNPFPFLTQTVPPGNVQNVWQFGTTFSCDVFPNPKVLFRDVDLLLIPKCIKAEAASEMSDLYGGYVNEKYSQIDDNIYWTLYRRNKTL